MSSASDYESMSDIAEGIIAVKYERLFFDVFTMEPGHREIYTVHKDGKIEYRYYIRRTQVVQKKRIIEVSPDSIMAFYSQIINCMQTATQVSDYIDDSDAKMTIKHCSGDIVLPGGLGTEAETIESITYKLLDCCFSDSR